MENTTPKAFSVWFDDLKRWSINSFFVIPWRWPSSMIFPLSTALERRNVPVEPSETANPRMATLHFNGEMEPRDLRGRSTLKGKLLLAQANDVIYSKIDVRNGAIGVVPASMPRVAVTSEFPVYRVRQNIALPEFIRLLVRTKTFRQQINNMISGASGRKRVEPDALTEIPVPLPPIDIQLSILSKWQEARQAIAKAEDRARIAEAEIEAQFLTELGLDLPITAEVAKVFPIQWTDSLRWSVSYNQMAVTGTDIAHGTFPIVGLGSILKLVQYGTSQKANTLGRGVPVIRMNNIIDGMLDLSALKHIALAEKERRGLTLQDGDILFNRTNSKELVGKCAVFHEPGEYIFASYLIRIRVQAERAAPDYVAHTLNSLIGRRQINAMSRQIIGQANINTEELRGLQIPLPPLDDQRRIMKTIAEGRSRIASERETARTMARQIEADLEGYLLGTKKVSAP